MTSIQKIAVCGAGGTMGAGIALVAARAGYETICFDMSEGGLARSRHAAEDFFQKSVEKGRMTADQSTAALQRMAATTRLEDLADCDLVIEAIFESLDVKRELFSKLNSICKDTTIFASNTSTLSITEIAGGSGRDDRVVGLHFCLPAQVMKLVEASRGIKTSDETFLAAWEWAVAAGQIPVETQDKPGFILNALLVPFNNDVVRAIEAGLCSADDIDVAIQSALGYKMGPCKLLDLIGLDTQVRLGEAFYPITLDKRASVPPLLRRMVAAGLLGVKSGGGLLSGKARERATSAPPFSIVLNGESRSFPTGDAFLGQAVSDGSVELQMGSAFHRAPDKLAVAVELDTECLAFHTGEKATLDNANVVGFARYRNGTDAPSRLIEIVKGTNTASAAIEAVRSVFECNGFDVVVCADQPGRVVDRLVRPKYNDALRFVDEGLASAADLDKTCAMGLGYPDGPVERVTRAGLARHFDVSKSIYDLTGAPGFFPARAAAVAKARADR
jgi:3-hydroxybutyryl-CoA dehydrogenase